MNAYVITVTATDRVGIVHSVTGTVRELGGHVRELSQTVMRGYFTIILAVEFAEPRDADVLRRTIAERGRRFGLTVSVLEADETSTRPAVPHGERFILTVLGADDPGHLHAIAGCLADHGVNIVDLHARTEGATLSLVMEAFLPPDLPPGTVRAALDRFGREKGLEAFVQHENIFTATSEPGPVRVGAGRAREGGDAVVPH